MAQCIAVVDPISTGGSVAAGAVARGYEVVAVWSREITVEFRAHVPPEARGLRYRAEVEELPNLSATAAAVRSAAGAVELVACIVGGESGVTLADALSEALGLRTNGSQELPGPRRNKSVQQRCVRAAGLRAVREACGRDWAEVADFLDSEPLPVVVKPVESAGSDGVRLCRSREEAEAHFHLLMDSQRKVGSQGAAVLVQEFLRGREYVVDHVSRDGVHKAMMVWTYDKRPTNDAEFVYYGMVPVEADSETARMLIDYTRRVLDALKVRNGPTHGEVMMTEDGPCLVEMNCRCAGCDGALAPVQDALTGYSQVSVALDAFLDAKAFERIPALAPSPFRAAGQLVMLVSRHEGTITATPGYDRIRGLPSFVSLQPSYTPGDKLELSTDLFTIAGLAILVKGDAQALARDIDAIRTMEREGELFEVESPAKPEPVGPSSGALAGCAQLDVERVQSNSSVCGGA